MKPLPFCLLVLSLAPSVWGQATVSEREYRALVQEYAQTTQQGITKQQARDWEQRWRTIKRVQCTDGRRLSPDHQAEADSMARALALAESGQAPKASPAAKARIEARAWLLREPALQLPDRGDPAAQAKAILKSAEYERARQKAPESALTKWLRERWEAFVRWLRSLALESPQKSPDLTGAATAIRIFLYVIAGLAVLGGLWLLLRHGSGWRWSRRHSAAGASAEKDDLTGATIPDPLGAANAAADRGDYRLAVRLAYIACLWRLRDAALLTLERHRTNWEYQSLLRRRDPRVAQQLLPATELYEKIWYGGASATQPDFTLLLELFNRLPEPPQ